MGNVVQTNVAPNKQVVALPFEKTNFTDANGTVQSVQATTDGYVMPWPGSIIGFGGTLNALLSTGTLTFRPTINGSLCPDWDASGAYVDLNSSAVRYTQDGRKSNYTFSAGDVVGLAYEKSGTVSPTTADGAFLVYVLLEEVQL